MILKFTEEDHSYVNILDNSKWTSVTTFLHSFEPKKDWDEIAKKYAKKNNMTFDEVKALWKSENERAIKRGHLFHKLREEDITSLQTINELPIVKSEFSEDGSKKSLSQILTPGIYPEILLYLKSAKICGQADRLEITNDYILNIDDWKTNKEIKLKAFVNWEGVEEKLTGPLSNIPNCNFWIYALQLNTYAYIALKNNPKLKLGKMKILHAKFNEKDEYLGVEVYEVPNLQKEVAKAIEYFKKKKK